MIAVQPPDDDPVVAEAYGFCQLQSGRVLMTRKLALGIKKLEWRVRTGSLWQQPGWKKYRGQE